MSYKVGKKFGIFEYNPKSGATKLRWYEKGEEISLTTYKRLSKATQAFCKRINKRKPKNV